MGMDVYGRNNKDAYFRASVWSWRPLAEYLKVTAPKLIGKIQYLHTNDGDGLNAKDSKALAQLLDEEIASGRAKAYVDERQARLDALPGHACHWCNGTGVRTDGVGIANGFEKMKVTNPDTNPRLGQTGWCNGCDGAGNVPDDKASYHLDLDRIERFTKFLHECGGFKIY